VACSLSMVLLETSPHIVRQGPQSLAHSRLLLWPVLNTVRLPQRHTYFQQVTDCAHSLCLELLPKARVSSEKQSGCLGLLTPVCLGSLVGKGAGSTEEDSGFPGCPRQGQRPAQILSPSLPTPFLPGLSMCRRLDSAQSQVLPMGTAAPV
jgi:hypothetical protein